MSEVWTPFEHQIWKNLKEFSLDSHNNFILAVSGGLDSMVLLDVFRNLKPQAQFKVVYYHHGPSGNPEYDEYRNRALAAVKHRVSELNAENLIFYSEKSSNQLASEDEMRNARWKYIKSLKQTDEVIVTAHHLDDRLETMLLKMIRGTSIDGFLSFKMWNYDIFRPFLDTTKSDLLDYAQSKNLAWVEDPSNNNPAYLRNWIRQVWLKDLDNRVESGSKNLAKSLLKIGNFVSENESLDSVFALNFKTDVLSRTWYLSLTKADQIRCLALFLKKHQINSFTSGQLEEIRKRLDKKQKDITFELLGRKWVINASQIMLQ